MEHLIWDPSARIAQAHWPIILLNALCLGRVTIETQSYLRVGRSDQRSFCLFLVHVEWEATELPQGLIHQMLSAFWPFRQLNLREYMNHWWMVKIQEVSIYFKTVLGATNNCQECLRIESHHCYNLETPLRCGLCDHWHCQGVDFSIREWRCQVLGF